MLYSKTDILHHYIFFMDSILYHDKVKTDIPLAALFYIQYEILNTVNFPKHTFLHRSAYNSWLSSPYSHAVCVTRTCSVASSGS